jgi:hypothetical protein
VTDPLNPAALLARLEALERSVASLAADVARLNARLNGHRDEELLDLDRVATSVSARAPSRAHKPATSQALRPLWTTADVESLVGRYGMLALATLTGLAAVGTFLGWAITHGLLGPAARVALGLAVAAALGAAGLRLRRRERSFGATLLGLALATTELCAWAAGPLLLLVPTWASLTLAAAVSVWLAAFAQRENDEPLWCVGFGGAAIAPFVASRETVTAQLLGSYGLIVLLAGSYALAGRRWPVASRVFATVTALFVTALMAMPEEHGGPLLAIGLPLVVALANLALAAGGPRSQVLGPRERRSGYLGPGTSDPGPAFLRPQLRSLGFFTAAAALRAGFATQLPLTAWGVAASIAVAGLVWLVIVDRTAGAPSGDLFGGLLPHSAGVAEWIDAAWVPLGFVIGVLASADAGHWGNAAIASAAALVLLVLAARRPLGIARDAAAFAASVCALGAVLLAGKNARYETTAAVGAAAVLFFAANRAWPSYSWVWLGGIALVGASANALLLLVQRTPYAYTPFVTRASGTALAIAACWALGAQLAPRIPVDAGRTFGAATVGAWVWAFLWVHQEIANAFSPTAATLLLVTYYAATSVISVGVGRARSVAWLRHAGLLLGLFAAFTAMRGARQLDAVGARITVYLVTSVFLLGIAYWYRKRDEA